MSRYNAMHERLGRGMVLLAGVSLIGILPPALGWAQEAARHRRSADGQCGRRGAEPQSTLASDAADYPEAGQAL
jgi:hypothetical protein